MAGEQNNIWGIQPFQYHGTKSIYCMYEYLYTPYGRLPGSGYRTARIEDADPNPGGKNRYIFARKCKKNLRKI